jgi:hypothetical protein
MTPIDRTKLNSLHQREETRFIADHPLSINALNLLSSAASP